MPPMWRQFSKIFTTLRRRAHQGFRGGGAMSMNYQTLEGTPNLRDAVPLGQLFGAEVQGGLELRFKISPRRA